MKNKRTKKLVSKALKQSANEALLEGAAAMSGQTVKSLAQSLVSGALMSQGATSRKARRKAQRKQFIKSLQKTKKEFKVEVGEPSKGIGIKDKKAEIKVGRPVQVKQPLNKKSTNKMKKESTFKMKGFSGFKNEK